MRAARPTAPADAPQRLVLDLHAVANAEGLTQEVALLRASIRQLAQDDVQADRVKVLAELRHQIATLCHALKTQQALAGQNGDTRAAELARVLDELGDDLEVAR